VTADDRGPDPCMCGTPYPCRATHAPDTPWREASTPAVRRQALADTERAVRDAKIKGGRL
jgi:hypothetical protein